MTRPRAALAGGLAAATVLLSSCTLLTGRSSTPDRQGPIDNRLYTAICIDPQTNTRKPDGMCGDYRAPVEEPDLDVAYVWFWYPLPQPKLRLPGYDQLAPAGGVFYLPPTAGVANWRPPIQGAPAVIPTPKPRPSSTTPRPTPTR